MKKQQNTAQTGQKITPLISLYLSNQENQPQTHLITTIPKPHTKPTTTTQTTPNKPQTIHITGCNHTPQKQF